MPGGTPVSPGHGASIDLIVSAERRHELARQAHAWPSWNLTPAQLDDLDLLITGTCAPLAGFLASRDVAAVCARMTLADGTPWPLPLVLDVDETTARAAAGRTVGLRDPEGVLIAAIHVEDAWALDREALAAINPADAVRPRHPWAIGGRVDALERPTHYDFRSARLTPAEVRGAAGRHGWTRVAAWPTDGLMHRADVEATSRAAADLDAGLLVIADLGPAPMASEADVTRVRACQLAMRHYPNGRAAFTVLPGVMRGSGPRRLTWQAILARNYGATHLLAHPEQMTGAVATAPAGVEIVPVEPVRFVATANRFLPAHETPDDAELLEVSAHDLERRLAAGDEIPEWFTFTEVAALLRRAHPPRLRQGFTVFFTGLSGSGKSTIARALRTILMERAGRHVTLLDGDLVRTHLSSELGFSREHRDLNVRRIGFVASEITRNGGAAIAAPIAPYDAARRDVRRAVSAVGGFALVHVSTPLEVCEARDRKGLYAKARAGLLPGMTGVSDPYEPPADADLTIDTSQVSLDAALEAIVGWLAREGFLDAEAETRPPD